MFDYQHDDLPVKDIVVASMQPSAGSAKHTLTPQVVRCELEDKYLNLRQENDHLKKKLHNQEDKMKKLATKLMRLVSEQKQQLSAPGARRALELQVTVTDQAECIDQLQATNRILHERVSVMRQQILEQNRVRVRIPGYLHGPGASPASSARRKKPPAPSSVRPANTPESGKSAEVETLRARIALLEQEKAGFTQRLEEAGLHEKKRQVGENEELMRVKRALSQQTAQLAALEERARAAEGDHAQTHHALSSAQREAEDVQQQRNLLKKRVLDLEAELQALYAERWRMLELEVAVKDLQRERDTLQGQNAWLLARTEERVAGSQDRSVHVTQLEERLASEVAQRAALQKQLDAVEKELAEVKSQAANALHNNSSVAGQDSSLISQVEQLEADLAREMRERVQILQMLEKLHDQQHQASLSRSRTEEPREVSTTEHGDQLPPSAVEAGRCSLLQSSDGSRELQEPPRPTIDVPPRTTTESRQCRSVGCNTETETRLDKCLQAVLDDGLCDLVAGQPPRVPSLEQSKLAVISRASRAPVLRIPTLGESAGVTDEPQSEATDADVSLLGDKSPGEVSSDSVGPGTGSERCPPDKSQGDATRKTLRHVSLPYCREKSQGEMSGETARSEQLQDISCPKSLDEFSSCLEVSIDGKGSHLGDMFSAADYLETVHELDKCRDLLRVQCRINSSLQDEVTSLQQRLGQTGTGHARQLAELRRRLDERTTPDSSHPTPRGFFELHMGHLQLCPGAESGPDRKLFLSWTFCDQEVKCTPPQPAHSSINFEFYTVYKVRVDRSFLNYLRTEACELELHALGEDGSQLEAHGALHFAELLHFPHYKLHTTVSLISPEEHTSVATAHCWFRLVCDADLLSSQEGMRPPHTAATTSPPAPVPVPRMAFPFSSSVTPVTNTVPTPAPRSSLQMPQYKSDTDSAAKGAGGEGGNGSKKSAGRVKLLADSVLGQRDSTQHRLTQILEEKWHQRKQTAAVPRRSSITSPVSHGSPSSLQEQKYVNKSNHTCTAQSLEVWLDYLRLNSDSGAAQGKKQQLKVECCFPGSDGQTTVTVPLFQQQDTGHGTVTLDFHTALKLDGEGPGSKCQFPVTPRDSDNTELHFVVGRVSDEGGDLQPLGHTSGDLVRAARSTVGRAKLQLDLVNSEGSVVGELGVSAALRSD